MYVLIVEDDDLVGEGIQSGLDLLGHRADWVRDARGAEVALSAANFDAVVLDLSLPDADGMDLLNRWRKAGRDTPVLILTARAAVPDRVAGLESGADDYLTKPFDLNELVARLHSLLRRAGGRITNVIDYGPLRLDLSTLQVIVEGEPIPLARRELTLLQALLQQPGRILTQGQLQDQLYGWSEGIESNAVAVHIHNLRRKLGRDLIETVRGVGYRMKTLTP